MRAISRPLRYPPGRMVSRAMIWSQRRGAGERREGALQCKHVAGGKKREIGRLEITRRRVGDRPRPPLLDQPTAKVAGEVPRVLGHGEKAITGQRRDRLDSAVDRPALMARQIPKRRRAGGWRPVAGNGVGSIPPQPMRTLEAHDEPIIGHALDRLGVGESLRREWLAAFVAERINARIGNARETPLRIAPGLERDPEAMVRDGDKGGSITAEGQAREPAEAGIGRGQDQTAEKGQAAHALNRRVSGMKCDGRGVDLKGFSPRGTDQAHTEDGEEQESQTEANLAPPARVPSAVATL